MLNHKRSQSTLPSRHQAVVLKVSQKNIILYVLLENVISKQKQRANALGQKPKLLQCLLYDTPISFSFKQKIDLCVHAFFIRTSKFRPRLIVLKLFGNFTKRKKEIHCVQRQQFEFINCTFIGDRFKPLPC